MPCAGLYIPLTFSNYRFVLRPGPLILRVLADFVLFSPKPSHSLHPCAPPMPASVLCPHSLWPCDSSLAEFLTRFQSPWHQANLHLPPPLFYPCRWRPARCQVPIPWHGKRHPSHLLLLMAPVSPGATSEIHAGPSCTLDMPRSFTPLCLCQCMLFPMSEGTSTGNTPGIIHKTALPNPLGHHLQVESPISLLTLLWFAQCFRHQ